MKDKISRSDFIKQVAVGGLGGLAFLSHPFALHSSPVIADNGFKVRGVYLDLRVEVMTLKALKKFVRHLSGLGINALFMGYEASYPYQKHAVISGPNAYRRIDIKELVSYCAKLDIEVIPLQQCLSHTEYILRHPRYAGLRVEESVFSMVDPLNEEAVGLFSELMEDMVSLHPSPYIHVGGDGGSLLNHKKFAPFIETHGLNKLYTQYMSKICQKAIDLDKTPIMWGKQYVFENPNVSEDMPIDQTIFIHYDYDADKQEYPDSSALREKGFQLWGAPALRSGPDNYYVTRWEDHFKNLELLIPFARRQKYEGMLICSWSTSGKDNYWLEGSHEMDVLEKFPMRNVYPLAGFNILVRAYAEALKMDEPLTPKSFVINYAQQQFGLSEKGGQTLWRYFTHPQPLVNYETIRQGEEAIEAILKPFKKINASIHRLAPQKNREDFRHFLLMGDIREFYLSVRKVEAMVESPEFDRSRIPTVGEQLKPLKEWSKKLTRSFTDLHKGYLHDSELERLNRLRNKRLHNLCELYCPE